VNQAEMKQRTKDFAKAVAVLCRQLPASREGRLIGDQLLRSACSVGANYRSACRGRSRADFRAKVAIVLEEADESLYWLELLEELGVVAPARTAPLGKEADELVAMLVATLRSSREGADR